LGAQQATTKEQLIGSWKVLSLKATTGNNIAYPLGEKVAGYVTITSDRIWLLFVDSTRKTPATPALTDAEAIGMMKSQVAWTGKYAVGEQTPDGIRLTAPVDAASSEAINNTDSDRLEAERSWRTLVAAVLEDLERLASAPP
jgi:Lipocalin-like domain